ncbi:MAG: 3-deoxy-8-phosphooctulonate synthase [Alphaproteobacteria bacterium]|nr:MAG: 3-deoxy-8-phosphooctulonate synthase [Alphaproteobacteria bacterium]
MSIRKFRSHIKEIQCGNAVIGGGRPLMVIAGPCVVEDKGLCAEIATEVKRVTDSLGLTYLFKASYDKANKTIKGSYRGPGVDSGLDVLKHVKAVAGVSATSDVHEPGQCEEAAEVLDLLQIPALLSKQIDLIKAAAATGKPVNIKKGQFTAPWEMNNVISRLTDDGYENTMVTDRGYMFGYQTMIVDMRGLQIMSSFGKPVIFDASHTVHGHDLISSGTGLKHREFIRPLARSAAANGIDGVFIEVHPDPDKALSDGAGTLALKDVEDVLKDLVAVDAAVSGRLA